MVKITKDDSGDLTVSLPYDPDHVAKIKAIRGSRWHPAKKHWSVPFSQSSPKKLLSVFEVQEISMDPSLCISPTTQDTSRLQDLKKELISRKYSPKTVKAYTFYNEDFVKFSGKGPQEIDDKDIRNYLYHLAKERQYASSTLNMAVNALKFYYGRISDNTSGS